MVDATADPDGLFLQHTQTGSSLTRIEHFCVRAFKLPHILTRHRGDAAHSLHHVQHKSFRLQQASNFTGYNHWYVAGLYRCAVFHTCRYLQRGVKFAEDFFSYSESGQYAFFFDQQARLSHRCFRNAAKRRMIAVTNIFGEGKIYEFVVKLFY